MDEYCKTMHRQRPSRERFNVFDPELIDEEIAVDFISSLANQLLEEKESGKLDLRQRFDELRRTFSRIDARPEDGATRRRRRWIGELRRLLARVCLGTLALLWQIYSGRFASVICLLQYGHR
jgi:hypothetical protein